MSKNKRRRGSSEYVTRPSDSSSAAPEAPSPPAQQQGNQASASQAAGQAEAQPARQAQTMRQWLERNKIFFETIAATLLAVMAVAVSFMTWQVSRNANDLLARQTDLAAEQLAPQLVLSAHQLRPPESQYCDDEELWIDNSGPGLARELQIEHVEVVETKTTRRSPPYGPAKQSRVVTIGYYPVSIHASDAATGRLITCRAPGRNRALAELERDFRDVAEKAGLYGDLQLRRYLRVTYKGPLGAERTRYYEVCVITGQRELSQLEGEQVFAERQTALTEGALVDFAQLTPDLLLKRAQ